MQEGSVCMLLCFRKYFQVSHFSVGGSRLFVLCRWLNLSSSKWCFASLTSTLLRLSQLLRGLDNRDGLLTLTVSIGALENSVSNYCYFCLKAQNKKQQTWESHTNFVGRVWNSPSIVAKIRLWSAATSYETSASCM